MMRRRCVVIAMAVLASLLGAQSAQAALQTIPGNPLRILNADLGQLQARWLPETGLTQSGFFFSGDTGSDGFFVRFADGPVPDTTYSSGYRGTPFSAVSNGPPSGNFTPSSPGLNTTVYEARDDATPLLEITQETRYVNTESRFRVTYKVHNVTAAPLRFRAGFAGDLYVDGNDSGTAVFVGTAPRFVGGTNTGSGVAGGLEEVLSSQLPGEASATPVPAWTNYELNGYSAVFNATTTAGGFTNILNGNEVDNGVGVEWEDHFAVGNGLAAGATARYEFVVRVRQPTPLRLSPAVGARELPASHTVLATLRDVNDAPVAGQTVRWDITGPHPQSGSGVSNASGQLAITWAGTIAGVDELTAYADIDGDAARDPDEPAQTARMTWLAQNNIDPPTVEAPALPGGGTLSVNVQTNPDDPDQRFFQIPNSQAGQYDQCPGGGREANLPISVPLNPTPPATVSDGPELVAVIPGSGNPATAPGIAPSPPVPPATGGVYRFVIECIQRYDLFLRYELTEGADTQVFVVPIGGIVLIDPQGVVYDRIGYDAAIAAGQSPEQARATSAITGATVRLQREQGGSFVNLFAADPGIAPNVNPQITAGDGRYQWDVSAGTYRVTVSAPGYSRRHEPFGRHPAAGARPAHPARARRRYASAARRAAAAPPPPPPPPPPPAPVKTIQFLKVTSAKVQANGSVVVGKVRCRKSTACRVRVTVSQTRKNGKRYVRAVVRIGAGKTGSLRVKLPKATTRLIRSGRKLKVKVALATTTGSAIGTATVTLKR